MKKKDFHDIYIKELSRYAISIVFWSRNQEELLANSMEKDKSF